MTGPSLALSELARLLQAHDLLDEVRGPGDVAVSGVSQDSRRVEPGDVFLAWTGTSLDAHDFVAQARERGAAAAVVERFVPVEVAQLRVRDGRRAAALVAHRVLGSPGDALRLVAITGTNGKTTTALLLRHLLTRRGPAAALGTLGLVEPDGSVRAGTEGLTTPGPVELAELLRSLVDADVDGVAMEASSHALEQRRLDALHFAAAVFTNLGRDHLDYHPDLEAYRAAKARLLDLLAEDGVAVVNADDPAWAALRADGDRITFGIDAPADLRAEEVVHEDAGSRFRLSFRGRSADARLPLPGRFNVENALAAAGAALALGLELEAVADALAAAPQVPGRLERVAGPPAAPCPILIDFAHTPEALERVLSTLRPLVPGRLIVVFGAGGDRDRAKRGPMAEAVARHGDLVVLTSDNPRTEDPERILDDLEEGLAGAEHERIADRREAIGRALRLAGPGDLVLLAGKGHERYQVVGTERRPLDERAVVRNVLARLRRMESDGMGAA